MMMTRNESLLVSSEEVVAVFFLFMFKKNIGNKMLHQVNIVLTMTEHEWTANYVKMCRKNLYEQDVECYSIII